MKRRVFLKGFPAVLAGPALLDSLGQANPSVNPPMMAHTSSMNVLFINIEDLSANAVGCYGNPAVKTPCLDRFAAEATRFSRCYCQAPICHPSKTSFLTGLRPDTTRVYEDADPTDQPLPEGTRFLPDILRQYNIADVNIGGLLRRGSTAAVQLRAFDHLECCALPEGRRGQSQGLPPQSHDALALPAGSAFKAPADSDVDKRTPALQAERAAHIFAQMAKQKKQFFMSLGFSRPRPLRQCPGEYLDLYDLSDIPSPSAKPEADANIPAVAKRLGRNDDIFNSTYVGPVADEVARQAIRAYYGCVSFIDAQIGMVLDAMERAGLADDTIVIIFSDHGFHLGEHGLWGNCTLFEQSTRVPLLVHIPGLTTKGAACDEIVELVDLLPTICELLVIPLPERLEGTSFAPLLADPRQPWKLAAFTICSIAGHVGRSVRTKRWRYADWQSRKTSLRQFELYDLNADPWEQKNLAQDADYRNQRTILANLLQRGWSVAHQRRALGSPAPTDLPSHQAGHILW